jgi:nitrogen fixation-related uncharacterized protein
MKKIGIIALIIIVLSTVGTLFFALFPALHVGAKSFLWSVSNDQYETAYEFMSPNFQKATSKDQFVKMVQRTGLDRYDSVEWEPDVFDPNKTQAHVQGMVKLDNGKRMMLRFDFIHIDGGSFLDQKWAIDKITILR